MFIINVILLLSDVIILEVVNLINDIFVVNELVNFIFINDMDVLDDFFIIFVL